MVIIIIIIIIRQYYGYWELQCVQVVGIPGFVDGKLRQLSRQLLRRMNIAQLQVVVNDLHTQIEGQITVLVLCGISTIRHILLPYLHVCRFLHLHYYIAFEHLYFTKVIG